MGERKRQRGWLQAEFELHLQNAVGKHLGAGASSVVERSRVVVDFREPDTTIAEYHVEEVMKLFDGGMLYTAIAQKLGIDRHQVTAAIRIWHERQGLPMPADGRVRRATVPDKRLRAAEFKAISEKAKALYDEDLLIEQIAEKLGYCRDTIHDSLVYWFESREQPNYRMAAIAARCWAIKNRARNHRPEARCAVPSHMRCHPTDPIGPPKRRADVFYLSANERDAARRGHATKEPVCMAVAHRFIKADSCRTRVHPHFGIATGGVVAIVAGTVATGAPITIVPAVEQPVGPHVGPHAATVTALHLTAATSSVHVLMTR